MTTTRRTTNLEAVRENVMNLPVVVVDDEYHCQPLFVLSRFWHVPSARDMFPTARNMFLRAAKCSYRLQNVPS